MTPKKTLTKAFTLIEVAGTIALVALGISATVIVGNKIVDSSRDKSALVNVSALNLAMTEYRDYIKRGYVPSTPWSATSEAGVIAELRKPLTKGTKVVRVIDDGDMDTDIAMDLAKPNTAEGDGDDYSSNAVWKKR